MSDENKKKSTFSIYWIYAIIGVAIIGLQWYMSSSSSSVINNQQTFFQLAEQGYVSKVFIVNRVRADFKLNKKGAEFVQNSKKGEFKQMGELFKNPNRKIGTIDPTYELELIDAGNFITKIDALNTDLSKKHKSEIQYISKTEHDYLGSIIGFLLPIVLLVVI